MTTGNALDIAYLHYGHQSGVTPHITESLTARGHRLTSMQVPGPLEFRDADGRRRVTFQGAAHLAISALRYGKKAIAHRWNTNYAFDVHSRRASQLLLGLERRPDVVLQNGVLYSPGRPPPYGYALLLDHTRALSMERPPTADGVLPHPVDYGEGWRERETAVYRGAGAIATFSRRVSESLQRDYGISGDKIHVVGAGANVYPEKVSRRDDGNTIVFIGKDFRRKGGPVLVRAFQRLQRQRPATRLVIAGPNESLDLPQGATNLGFVPPDKLADVLAQATVFALPTLKEPFGIAFLDAMACGVPCIGTAIEAVPEVIDHQVSGLLVPPGNDIALAEALLSLLEDPARAHAMGLRGRLRVDAQFTWNHVGEKVERALLAARGRVFQPPANVVAG